MMPKHSYNRIRLAKARCEGKRAASIGLLDTAMPFREGSPEEMAWDEGYDTWLAGDSDDDCAEGLRGLPRVAVSSKLEKHMPGGSNVYARMTSVIS